MKVILFSIDGRPGELLNAPAIRVYRGVAHFGEGCRFAVLTVINARDAESPAAAGTHFSLS